jgi:hypothetical protein
MPATLLKKISAKTVMGNVKEIAKGMKDGERKELFKLLGVCKGVKTGESAYGEYTEFHGAFFAVNLLTDEEFEGAKAFLIDPWTGMLLTALEGNESVEFAITVSIIARDDLPMGYEYVGSPMVETRRADPLAALKQAAGLATLPAPAEAETAPEEPKVKKGKAV